MIITLVCMWQLSTESYFHWDSIRLQKWNIQYVPYLIYVYVIIVSSCVIVYLFCVWVCHGPGPFPYVFLFRFRNLTCPKLSLTNLLEGAINSKNAVCCANTMLWFLSVNSSSSAFRGYTDRTRMHSRGPNSKKATGKTYLLKQVSIGKQCSLIFTTNYKYITLCYCLMSLTNKELTWYMSWIVSTYFEVFLASSRPAQTNLSHSVFLCWWCIVIVHFSNQETCHKQGSDIWSTGIRSAWDIGVEPLTRKTKTNS